MAFNMKDIRVYLGNQWKQMEKRGNNFVNSDKILSVIFDRDLKHVQGRVAASKRPTGYTVWVEVKGNPEAWMSKCECARANATTCAHRAALLIKAYKTVSCTSMPCEWSRKKLPEDGKVHTLASLSNRQVVRPECPPVSPQVFDRLKKDLEECPDESGAGVLFLLKEEISDSPVVTTRTQVPDAYDILKGDDSAAAIVDRLRISWENIIYVAGLTSGQAVNPEWARIRRCRLTASKFGDILKTMKKPCPSPASSLLEGLFIHRKLDGVRALLWGRTHEKVALELYTTVTGKSVTPTGIWLHEDGFLGASPDGLVDDDTIIEVKCPYSYRNDDLEEVLQKKSSEKYVIFRRNRQWLINTEHNYYHQIQGCLHFSKREKAVLFVWTSLSYQAFPITKDPNWLANISILERFYFDHFVPYARNRML